MTETWTVRQLKQFARQQRRDSIRAHKKVWLSILGGPSYNPEASLGVGGAMLMTFRMNPDDTISQRSFIPVGFNISINGTFVAAGAGTLFFNENKFRIYIKYGYRTEPANFYGIGYSTNKDYERGEDTSEYRYSGIQVNPWFLFRLGESNIFAGPQVDLNYDKITKPAAGMVNESSYIAAGGTEHGYKNFSSGLGFLLTYDTRDIPANAYSGTYLDFRGMMYNKVFGSDNNFYRLEIDYRQYKTVGRRKVIAWTVQSKNAFGDVPLTKYMLSGTPFDLRGYYMGQFRDKSSHVMMAEYRQMINTDKSTWVKKMLSHIGYVAWGGCGFMGPTPGKIEGVLPNLGLGLRIEVQPRMNVRLDFGRDMVNKQNLFYFNMTEAF